MATVRTICTRALRRSGVVDLLNDPAAEEASLALSVLNETMHGWRAKSVDTLHTSFTLSDTFVFWVPPTELSAETQALVAYQGTWNASTNSPALASATGTEGHVYKVSTAGSTTLDDVTSWAANDFAVFDGTEWLKGEDSQRFEGAVIAILGLAICDELAVQPSAKLVSDARDGWNTISAAYVTPPHAVFDDTLTRTPQRGPWY